jgi:hypothetical protein
MRDKIIQVKLTDEEQKKIYDASNETGVPLATFVRISAIEKTKEMQNAKL